ncbi:hypothetical protein SELMODRAFT_75309 [Selaginella moellendorffii]|uniref:methylated diphthine methylhydrolase n=1 Tax=Selaginella moellendorffii TaxID=88036 RepID=D8QPR8_SELML|nr:hypothetical protein SELMODRAFT_75309 [Selaginella moellendorffii]
MDAVELDGNADAVEFCPVRSHSHALAAATYNLVEATPESPARRLGSVSLFEVIADPSPRLRLVDRKKTSGVFDIRWRPPNQGNDAVLAQAGADGVLTMYALQGSDSNSLEKFTELEVCDSAMCLSVDWNPFATSSQQELVVSHSNGSISLVSMSRGRLELDRSWEAHGFEAWTATYDAWIQGLVYTGGDDSQFCGWDLRASLDSPVFRDAKSHEMGVCCVQSNPLWENVVATGSYDERLRLWDVRMAHRPFATHKIGLGGGVWRLKWHPVDKGTLVAACMHSGFAIVAVDEQRDVGVGVVKEYKEHKSLAYGVDWSKNNESLPLVASCSFYDNALHLWRS